MTSLEITLVLFYFITCHQVNVAPQDADHKGEEAADHKEEEAAGPSNREDHSGKRRNEDDDTESQKSSESEQRPKSDDDDSDNDEKNKSDSEKEESVSEDNEDKKSRGSSSASSKKSKSSQEDEEKEERVEETKNKDVEVKEGGVKDVVLAQNEVNLSYEKKVEKALVGDMDFEYPEKAKIVRIFTSSTFTGIFFFLSQFLEIISVLIVYKKVWMNCN